MGVIAVKKIRCICLLLTSLMLVGCGNQSVTTTVPVPSETVPEEVRISFVGVGDNLIHNCVYWQADENAPGDDYDFKPMYELVSDDIYNADIAYINQETILGGTEIGISSYPLFNSPQELGRDMIDLGFDVFSHATNHVFDKGEKGLANTYAFYEQNPNVTCIGLHKKGEDIVKIVERKGVKIAFVNYTYLTNGFSHPKGTEYNVALADFDDTTEMVETIRSARESSDFVVCCVHWGDEGATKPNSKQKKNAQILADAGCDVIIGTHPHAIQPVEYIDDTLVVYSLGNFISAQKSPINLLGGMIYFDFVKDTEGRRIENVRFRPVINQYGGGFDNIHIVPFDMYTKELAASHGAGVSYEYFDKKIKEIIDEEFLVGQ